MKHMHGRLPCCTHGGAATLTRHCQKAGLIVHHFLGHEEAQEGSCCLESLYRVQGSTC